MDVITIDSNAFKAIMERMSSLEGRFAQIVTKANNPLTERWLTGEDVMKLLGCCKRTLQKYRSKRMIPHTAIGHTYYYRAVDVEKFLNKYHNDIKGY
ncbi:MAG: helix-turn-helix domain-containing protein [Bacteroidota bacterium]